MGVLIRHYLHTEPAENMETLLSQYVEAIWIEERQINVTASAISKAFGDK